MKIRFGGRDVTPVILLPDGTSVAMVDECALLLVDDSELRDLLDGVQITPPRLELSLCVMLISGAEDGDQIAVVNETQTARLDKEEE